MYINQSSVKIAELFWFINVTSSLNLCHIVRNQDKNKKMKKILTLLVFAITFSTVAQEEVLLRLNYKKGDTYLFKVNMEQDMGMMQMTMNMNMQTDVTDASEDAIETKNKFVKITMEMNAMGEKMKYDSDDKEEDMDEFGKGMHSKMKDLKDVEIAMTYDKLGNIKAKDLKDGQEAVANLFKENSSSFVLPKEAVKVGSSWTFQKESKGMTNKYKYTVKEIKEDTVLIDVTGEVTGEGEGTSKGTGVIERATGLLLNMELDMDMKVKGMDVEGKMKFTTEKL